MIVSAISCVLTTRLPAQRANVAPSPSIKANGIDSFPPRLCFEFGNDVVDIVFPVLSLLKLSEGH